MAEDPNTKPEDLALQTFALLAGLLNRLEGKGVLSAAEADDLIRKVSAGYASEAPGGPKVTGAPLLDALLKQRESTRS